MSRTKLNDLPPKLRQQATEQMSFGLKGGATRKAPVTKRDLDNALETRTQTLRIDSPVCLVVLMYRCKGIRWDLDNATFKPFLDAIVQAGVLEDDSQAQIKGIIKLARVAKNKAEERTELEFWDANYFMAFIDQARGTL